MIFQNQKFGGLQVFKFLELKEKEIPEFSH